MISLIHGDCRMVELASGAFDCCIADPPYGDTSLSWDTICPGWIPRMAELLKPSASIWVFGSMRFLAPLFAEMRAHGFVYSQDIVWEKQNGTGFHADRFRRVHEHAVLFYRGAWGDVHHDTQYTMDAVARTVRVRVRTGPQHFGDVKGGGIYETEEGGPRMARSVLQVRNEHGRAIHPTQKPLKLLVPLIRYSVPVDGWLIDPFAGSGSTLLAAQIEGRNATGIELDAGYALAAQRRIRDDAPLFQKEPT